VTEPASAAKITFLYRKKGSKVIVVRSALVPTFRLGALLASAFVAVAPLEAQSNDSPSTARASKAPKVSRSARWSADVESKAAFQYDHNVFLLSSSQRGALASPSADAVASGRYTGMESANDMLAVGTIGVQLSGPGVAGRALEITPELSYEFASRNQLRREAAGALSIAQSLGGGRRIRLSAKSAPSHFSRNYLSEAVDADANGSISPSERIYTRGEYAEYSIGGEVRLPFLAKSKKGSLAVLSAGAGYYARSYDAPFAVRDLSGPTAALGLAFGQKSPVGLELTYELAALSATKGTQVVLLNEPVYNIDFNGNGRATDLEARALVDIDRSRLEQQLGGALKFETGPRLSGLLGYEYRLRSFRSKLPYDEADAGRRDNRSGIRGSLRTRLAKGVSMSAGAKFLTQTTNRGLGSVLGEEADYKNLVASVGLQASF